MERSFWFYAWMILLLPFRLIQMYGRWLIGRLTAVEIEQALKENGVSARPQNFYGFLMIRGERGRHPRHPDPENNQPVAEEPISLDLPVREPFLSASCQDRLDDSKTVWLSTPHDFNKAVHEDGIAMRFSGSYLLHDWAVVRGRLVREKGARGYNTISDIEWVQVLRDGFISIARFPRLPT